MKTVHHFNTARDKLLHIETEGAIVNIRIGLSNTQGQNVTSIEILPDIGSCPIWTLPDFPKTNGMPPTALNVRVVQSLT